MFVGKGGYIARLGSELNIEKEVEMETFFGLVAVLFFIMMALKDGDRFSPLLRRRMNLIYYCCGWIMIVGIVLQKIG